MVVLSIPGTDTIELTAENAKNSLESIAEII